MHGAEAVRDIDWASLGPASPIPQSMPAVAESEDPLEAGFAHQWIERIYLPESSGWRKLALEIASARRRPDDPWAVKMERELREIVRAKVPAAQNLRVFCNSVGCLCYVEREEREFDPIVYRALLGERARRFGLQRSDLDAVIDLAKPAPHWELTVVKRPKLRTPSPPTSGTQASASSHRDS
jgi:hypothetical protein